METNGKYVGKVKWYNEHRGYGYIATKDYGDFYFHATGIVNFDEPPLRFGDIVTFTTLDGPKGIRAINIKRISFEDLQGTNLGGTNHEYERRTE